jgi:hypothetical protein
MADFLGFYFALKKIFGRTLKWVDYPRDRQLFSVDIFAKFY